MTHPNIIAGALREAAVLVTSGNKEFNPDSTEQRKVFTDTFEFLLNVIGDSPTLAAASFPGAEQVPAPAQDPFPQPQVAAPAPQAAPAPAPAPAPQPQYQPQPQQQFVQPAAMPQAAPPPPASISPNSTEDELWASLIAEVQANGRLVTWEDKRPSKGPNARGADFAHTQIQKQSKDGKWWPMGLWINNRTPGWVLPALQQIGMA